MTFDSVYEILDDLTTVRKQKFWSWFDGSALRNEFWQTNNVTNTGTFAMRDVINGGFGVTTAAIINSRQNVNHGNIEHYNFNASVIIMQVQAIETSLIDMACGLAGGGNDIRLAPNTAIQDLSSVSFIRFFTENSGGTTFTDSTVASGSGTPQVWKIETLSSSCEATILGVLENTHTGNLPDSKLEPNCQIESDQTATKTMAVRYVEVFNR